MEPRIFNSKEIQTRRSLDLKRYNPITLQTQRSSGPKQHGTLTIQTRKNMEANSHHPAEHQTRRSIDPKHHGIMEPWNHRGVGMGQYANICRHHTGSPEGYELTFWKSISRDRGHSCLQPQPSTSRDMRLQKITNIVDPFVLFNNSYTLYLNTPIHPYIVTLWYNTVTVKDPDHENQIKDQNPS